jgi:hypothetical protein
VVHGGYDIKLELAICSGLEDTRVDFDLFDTGTVEFFEGCDDASLLTGARGTVDEEMWEIAALGLRTIIRLAVLHRLMES